MKVSTLLSVLGGVAAVAAAPLQDVQKRASGFRFGGVNLAVSPDFSSSSLTL